MADETQANLGLGAAEEVQVLRQQMEEKRTSITEKLESLEAQVTEKVQNATTAVNDTIDNVKDSVQETVEQVRGVFDLSGQVQRHPWAMVAGSVALGCIGAWLLHRPRRESRDAAGPATLSPATLSTYSNGVPASPARPAGREKEEPGWFAQAVENLKPELGQLKGLAVGAVAGLVRDMLTDAVPEGMKSELSKVMDGVTSKLGGQPIRGQVLPQREAAISPSAIY